MEEKKAEEKSIAQHRKLLPSFFNTRVGQITSGAIIALLLIGIVGRISETEKHISPKGTPTLKGGDVACLNRNLFNEITQAIINEDQHQWNYLLKNGCIVTRKGPRVSIIDRDWQGVIKVRVYGDDDSVILWTNSRSIVY